MRGKKWRRAKMMTKGMKDDKWEEHEEKGEEVFFSLGMSYRRLIILVGGGTM